MATAKRTYPHNSVAGTLSHNYRIDSIKAGGPLFAAPRRLLARAINRASLRFRRLTGPPPRAASQLGEVVGAYVAPQIQVGELLELVEGDLTQLSALGRF
jgi:hypothetical protein